MASEDAANGMVEALSEVSSELRRWAAQGPPSKMRACCGSLADKIQATKEGIETHEASSKQLRDQLAEVKDHVSQAVERANAAEQSANHAHEVRASAEEQLKAKELQIDSLQRSCELIKADALQEDAAAKDRVAALENTMSGLRDARNELEVKLSEKTNELQAELAVREERLAMLRADNEALASSRAEAAKLRKENALLASQFATVLSPVSVMCRTRPLETFKDHAAGCAPLRSALTTEGTELTVEMKTGPSRKFRVDRILGETASQADVFTAATPWVENVARGGSSCVFAYGATGAGKTHTVLGGGGRGGPTATRGLAHHALQRLIEGPKGGEVRVSMLEVYCDQIRDLLSEPSAVEAGGAGVPATAAAPLAVHCSKRDSQGRMVLDCVELPASTFAKAEAILRHGFAQRATEGTRCNGNSSRSHVVLTVRASGAPNGSTTVNGGSVDGRLVLVDLAGSENIQRSGADEGGQLLAEAKAINKSLSALADVVEAIAKQQSFVPYRNTRLTMLLEESLSISKVLFLVHVSPQICDATDTGHALQFASRVQAIDFGAQRQRQDQEDRMKAAQLRNLKVEQELEKVKKERDELAKAQREEKKVKKEAESRQKEVDSRLKEAENVELQRLRQQVLQLQEQNRSLKDQESVRGCASPPPNHLLPPRPNASRQRRSGVCPPTPTRPVRQAMDSTPDVADRAAQARGRVPLGDLTNAGADEPTGIKKIAASPLKDMLSSVKACQIDAPKMSPRSPVKADESGTEIKQPTKSPAKSQIAAAEAAGGPEPPVAADDDGVRYNTYQGMALRSCVRQPTDWNKHRQRCLRREFTGARVRISEEVPVPQPPPQWYMDCYAEMLAAERMGPVLRPYLPLQDEDEQPAAPSLKGPGGTPMRIRQFTPPPRKREVPSSVNNENRENRCENRCESAPRWRR